MTYLQSQGIYQPLHGMYIIKKDGMESGIGWKLNDIYFKTKSLTTGESNMNNIQTSNDYNYFLVEIKQQIKSSQIKTINSVNKEMIMLYFGIGKSICQKLSLLLREFSKKIMNIFFDFVNLQISQTVSDLFSIEKSATGSGTK